MESKQNGGSNGLGAAASRVRADLGDLGRAIAAGKESLTTGLARFVQANPLMAIGIAIGVGYLLGGGLFSRTTGRAVGLGMRLGGAALLRDIVRSLSNEIDDTTISADPV